MKKYFAFIVFGVITFFFFRPILLGMVPIPLDILVGAYYPWLDYKWGFVVGVPVRNASVTDVFSQLYPWRTLAMDIWRSGQIPLWNPYSLGGTPLLANWQSAPFYPLNILMLLFGNLYGWTAIIVLQPLLSMVFMYLYLSEVGLRKTASFCGAVIFAFAGFMTTYLEYSTAGQAFLWLPLSLMVIEKYLKNRSRLWLLALPLIIFAIVNSGFFQPAFYAGSIVFLYFIFRSASVYGHRPFKKFLSKISFGLFLFAVGIGLSAIQLIPTFELLFNSIRNRDQNIVSYNYGLLPLKNIVTFLVPDFYGNPSTNNFWGFMGYQETAGYFGIVALVFVLVALLRVRQNFLVRFFGILFIVSAVLAFDTILGRLLYILKVPGLSTGYASRLLLVTTFSASVLAAFGVNEWQKHRALVIRSGLILVAVLVSIVAILFLSQQWLLRFPGSTKPELILNLKIAMRNGIFSSGLFFAFVFSFILFSKNKLGILVIVLFITLDILRFGIKFTPFSPVRLNYPTTAAIDFVTSNIGHYRMDRERTEVMPPNSWMPYKMMTPSGYDPLHSVQYAAFYKIYDSDADGITEDELRNSSLTRYEELNNYGSPFVDLAGVKYIFGLKRNEGSLPDPNGQVSYRFSDKKYQQVFEDKSTVVMENTSVMPRVVLFDAYDIEPDYILALSKLSKGYDFRNRIIINEDLGDRHLTKNDSDQVKIVGYTPNKVDVSTQTTGDTLLLLTDAYYPGWVARVDGEKQKLFVADGAFRATLVPPGNHLVSFSYEPGSFRYSVIVSGISLVIIIAAFILFRKNKDAIRTITGKPN